MASIQQKLKASPNLNPYALIHTGFPYNRAQVGPRRVRYAFPLSLGRARSLLAVEHGARPHEFVDVLAENGVLRLELAVLSPDVVDAAAQVLQGVLQLHDLK